MLTDHEKVIIQKWNDFSGRRRDNIVKFREDLEKFCIEMGINDDLPAIGALHQDVALRSGLSAEIAVPKGNGPYPVVLLIHGGGWMAGSPGTHRKLAMQFAEKGYLTVNLDYRLAPEYPFPAGFDDCVFAATWTRENIHAWSGDPSRTAIAGDSAGANLAAAVLVAFAVNPSAPKFRAAALIYGVFDFPGVVEGSLNRGAAEGMARGYLGGHYPAALNDPRVSPLRAITTEGLPPCLIICGTADVLLPQSRSMAAALKEVGTPFELHEIGDMPHAFMMIGDLSGCGEGHRLMFNFLGRYV